MSEEAAKGSASEGPIFTYQKHKWQPFVQEAKQFRFDGKRNARWVIETNPQLRTLLKEQAAPPAVPGDAESEAKHRRNIFQQQLTAFNFLEKRFYGTNPTLFKNVDMTDQDFATKIFTELHELWKPTGINDTDSKLEEKEAAFEGFAGEPHAYFERLLLINGELKDLSLPDKPTRDVKRAGDAIF
eukprot:311172-Rhodomonas_salina.1